MPTIAGRSTSIPFAVPTGVISIATQPLQVGGYDLSLRFDSCVATAQASDLPRLEFSRRYGKVMQPYQSDFVASVPPLDLIDKWATLRLIGVGGFVEKIFTGVIKNAKRTVHGAGVTTGPTGVQRWTAFGPFSLLLKTPVEGAFFEVGGSAVLTDRVESFNLRDDRGRLVGNRSATAIGGTFVFGGTSLWTRAQALDYLLTRFTGQTFGGIFWTVTGTTEVLAETADVVEVGGGQSVGSMVRAILSPQFGLDFTVEIGSGGFEVRVFSQVTDTATYLGNTLRRNAKRVRLNVGDRVDFTSTEFVQSTDQRYSRILVKGGSVLSCFTLRFSDGTLALRWAAADETTYKAGTGTPSDPPDAHDQARQTPALNQVFRLFGASSAFTLGSVSASPLLNKDGELVGVNRSHQNTKRSTLSWLPLRSNVDYVSALVDKNPAGHEADFLRPLVWILDPETNRYVTLESLGFGVSVLENAWGFQLSGPYGHRLALNNFAGAASSSRREQFDYTTIVATIAVRTDFRLQVETERSDGDGTTLELEVPGAEFWLLAGGTVVGVDSAGALQTRAASLTLRDDRDGLGPIMASAIGRYFEDRTRAQLNIQGLQPWSPLIGTMVSEVQQGGDDLELAAPITNVTYNQDPPTTIVRAGYAR